MYERLLVAVDHSDVSARVIAAAKDLASLSKGKVWVLHLLEKEVIAQMGDVPSESDAEADQAVKDGVDILRQAGIDAEGEVRRACRA
jgi:nucleotide-binding universal stress UspA family protein